MCFIVDGISTVLIGSGDFASTHFTTFSFDRHHQKYFARRVRCMLLLLSANSLFDIKKIENEFVNARVQCIVLYCVQFHSFVAAQHSLNSTKIHKIKTNEREEKHFNKSFYVILISVISFEFPKYTQRVACKPFSLAAKREQQYQQQQQQQQQ